MCGRYININKISRLKKLFFDKEINNIKNMNSYNISPSQQTIIITNKNSFLIEDAKWGFEYINKEDNLHKTIINSRVETINSKLIFKDSFLKRKCIIPTNGYFEWKTNLNFKQPYLIHYDNLKCFYFAGIWKYSYINNIKFKVFTIITKQSNENLNFIHHRMPIIFSFNEANDYLNSDLSEYLSLNFASEIEDDLLFHKVSKFVNNPKNNSEECIKLIN